MASIHIIYDPDDKIEHGDPRERKRFGIKVAVLSVSDDIPKWKITHTAAELACLLLEQLAGDRTENSSEEPRMTQTKP